MKKLVIHENQMTLLKDLLFEVKIGKALPKLSPDDMLVITNNKGEQVKYIVIYSLSSYAFFKTTHKKTNKEYFVHMSVTSLNDDNTLEVRSLEDKPENKDRMKDPLTWPQTKLKDITGIEVFNKNKHPKLRIDVDDDPSDDHTSDDLVPEPNQPYIDGEVDRDGNPIAPDEIPNQDKVDKITSYIEHDPKLFNAFGKRPSFWDAIQKGDPMGLFKAEEILSKYFNKTLGNNFDFVDKFRQNQKIKFELMEEDYQYGSHYLDINKQYAGTVKRRVENVGVLIKITNNILEMILTKHVSANVYMCKIRVINTEKRGWDNDVENKEYKVTVHVNQL
tara:strand:+ start:31691 stop:32689 length:999 start_codon:yes stop_codon:yes gene_type:complete